MISNHCTHLFFSDLDMLLDVAGSREVEVEEEVRENPSYQLACTNF